GMLLFAWAIVTSGIVESAFGTSQVYTSMLYALIFLSSLDFFLEPLVNGQSRRHEFEADAYSAKALGSGQHLISALKNLAKHN
ncbi:M48 family metalloprotease, partial [Klebsiella quasipneumoniae]|uniref:M48 family metalloprotease n=1 Tax=Klebsiella quasipneumoniae TaxID=1463165 RepID=UPI00272F1B89